MSLTNQSSRCKNKPFHHAYILIAFHTWMRLVLSVRTWKRIFKSCQCWIFGGDTSGVIQRHYLFAATLLVENSGGDYCEETPYIRGHVPCENKNSNCSLEKYAITAFWLRGKVLLGVVSLCRQSYTQTCMFSCCSPAAAPPPCYVTYNESRLHSITIPHT